MDTGHERDTIYIHLLFVCFFAPTLRSRLMAVVLLLLADEDTRTANQSLASADHLVRLVTHQFA